VTLICSLGSVLKRWQEGEHNGLILWREIVAQGYTGSDRTVYRHIQTLKQAHVQACLNPARLHKFTASTAVWLFVRDPKSLDEVEQEDLATFCQASPTLKRTYDLVADFMQMVRKREGYRLNTWLEQVAASDLPELQSFAAGVEKDKDAVRAGLTGPVNNGQVEGQVTKLKRDFTYHVWKGWISSSATKGSPRHLTIYYLPLSRIS
jgi:transposase